MAYIIWRVNIDANMAAVGGTDLRSIRARVHIPFTPRSGVPDEPEAVS